MAYYFVSLDTKSFTSFQKRYQFLAHALFITDKKYFKDEEISEKETNFFFVHYAEPQESIDDLVLAIREKSSSFKVLYIIDHNSALDLKKHQMTPVGGDVYISHDVDEKSLKDILAGLLPPDINPTGNKLEDHMASKQVSEIEKLQEMKNDVLSLEIDALFKKAIPSIDKKPLFQNEESLNMASLEDAGSNDMSIKDDEISLEGLEEFELGDIEVPSTQPVDEGMDLNIDDGPGLSLVEDGQEEEMSEPSEEEGLDFDLGEDLNLETSDDDSEELSLDSSDDELSVASGEEEGELDLGLGDDIDFNLAPLENEVSDASSTGLKLDFDTDLGETDALSLSGDISDDAREKLKEIDAIMDHDATQAGLNVADANLDDSFSLDVDLGSVPEEKVEVPVSEEINLDGIDFSLEPEEQVTQVKALPKAPAVIEEITTVMAPSQIPTQNNRMSNEDFREMSNAYSGEMERTQATISNLRSDREELLSKIQHLEEDKILQNRQMLSLRAELDEKKIELTIIRKKNNEEISDLKDRIKLFDEKRLIFEEKNKIMQQELDKASQRNKLDVKKVQLHERELEQRLELLKSDAETQIKNRDLKILELKRKIDAMEFDMESISTQEKRSVESRYELEDKLEKAIKTLRNAITVLEDESDKGNALDALKKNIDM